MDDTDDFIVSDSDSELARWTGSSRRSWFTASHVLAQPRTFARSICANFEDPPNCVPELQAINDLKDIWLRHADSEDLSPANGAYEKELLIFDLGDFSISERRGHKEKSEWALSPLHRLNARHLGQTHVCGSMIYSGLLSIRGVTRFIKNAAFDTFSVDGYGDDENPTATIFLQSKEAQAVHGYDIWYRLNRPSAEYQECHQTFLWIATFGKHFVDYLESRPANSVNLQHFRSDFFRWVSNRFGGDEFHKWQNKFGHEDFRQVVNANLGFLFNQAGTLDEADQLLSHPVWADCGSSTEKIEIKREPTVVTSFVFSLFKNMYFSDWMKECHPSVSVKKEMNARKVSLGLLDFDRGIRPALSKHDNHISQGDVVSLKPDLRSAWKTTDREWLAYVQSIEHQGNGDTELSLLWLYRPADTTIGDVDYPIKNELFFSDHCNCGSPAYPEAVIGKYDIDWNPTSKIGNKDYIIRQTYLTSQHEFVTFQQCHLVCICRSPNNAAHEKTYRRGQCVYIRAKQPRGKVMLEPVVVDSRVKTDGRLRMRRLLRLERDCKQLLGSEPPPNIPPNELVWTDEFITVSKDEVDRPCNIRFFPNTATNPPPIPYNRNGSGDYWFFSFKLVHNRGMHELENLTACPRVLQESLESNALTIRQLRGLSLFSGGGNFDRGLEEGGAVQFDNAIDISKEAVLTQRANILHPGQLHTHLESVDTVLRAVLRGSTKYAQIGRVEYISAGSPCPGFSSLQKDTRSPQSLKNASLVTTFLSFIDIFRPSYAILENVVNIARVGKGQKGTKVLNTIISCLVAMGYQVQQFVLDAWNHGSIQRRSRIFLCITSPGLTPLQPPPHTHGHPEGISANSLGILSNGQKFAQRENYPTPFCHRTACEALDDLPNIGNGALQACVAWPDHRVVARPNQADRALIECIPYVPWGLGLAHANGIIPEALIRNHHTTESNGLLRKFKRITPRGLISTITTSITPRDSRTGDCLHWNQPRPITIMEARETQGIPRDEVIVGNTTSQIRIIGNGVDRNVAFVLGQALMVALSRNVQQGVGILHTLSEDIELGPVEGDDIMVEGMPVRTTDSSRNSPMPLRLKRPRDNPSPERSTSSETTGSGGSKRTRHSGLTADYIPKRWDQRVEVRIAKTNGNVR
ncbi:S-adenosyl-L-methionine-dependent methyltransferase [Polyplosphaeria fusca]|uniref:DNA (cytosine-5-)-methyltransferase n=1 Tax=Polyplosphaeria fusca TaxID=682080 RepID=A0A9P4R082_9PLEO|nr:S-adenosyl-L-methionine-dependent methyltransferase [Polyplosphaeria fusca]